MKQKDKKFKQYNYPLIKTRMEKMLVNWRNLIQYLYRNKNYWILKNKKMKIHLININLKNGIKIQD